MWTLFVTIRVLIWLSNALLSKHVCCTVHKQQHKRIDTHFTTISRKHPREISATGIMNKRMMQRKIASETRIPLSFLPAWESIEVLTQESLKWTQKVPSHCITLLLDSLLRTHFGLHRCTCKERSGRPSVESLSAKGSEVSVWQHTMFPPLRWMKNFSGEEKPDFVEQFISPLTVETRTYS